MVSMMSCLVALMQSSFVVLGLGSIWVYSVLQNHQIRLYKKAEQEMKAATFSWHA